MPITDRPQPTIKLVFRGLSVTRIQDGADSAEIGVISAALDHPLKVTMKKSDALAPIPILLPDFDPNEDIFIEVEHKDAPKSGIKLFTKDGFKRDSETADVNDFGWVIDLESKEFIGKALEPRPGSLKPIIRIDEAEFYADQLSDVKVNKKLPGEAEQPFGKVAVAIGANIYLDWDSKATLKYGSKVVRTMGGNENVQYVLTFDTDCKDPTEVSDFKLIYQALVEKDGGGEIQQPLDLEPELHPDARAAEKSEGAISLTVRCTNGNLSLPKKPLGQ